ncbi:MAG TPA: FG-GAP-like repeat-containing protein, partial [Candidatus Saccharimonadales bacterium]
MDFNGDGKDDYAVSTFHTDSVVHESADEEEDIHIALSTGTSFATANTLKAYDMYSNSTELGDVGAPPGTTLSGIFYIDMNGDGQVDVFNYRYDPVHDTEYYRVWLNAAASSTTPQEQPSMSYSITPTPPTSPNFEIKVYEPPALYAYLDFSQAIPMDLNGDGKTELVNVIQRGPTPQKVIVSFDATQTYGQPGYKAEVDGISNPGIPGNGIVIQTDTSSFIYNINRYVPNDTIGLDSESYYKPIYGVYSTYFSGHAYDNVYGVTTSINNGSSPYVLFGDFNGDGITDVLSYGSTSWTMHLGRGRGSYASLPVSTLSSDNPFSYPTHYYYAHDVNGDGKTDILEFTPNYAGSGSTVINTYYSTGTSFVEGDAITLSGHDINPETWQIAFGDFNGDGVDDLLLENVVGDGAVNGPPLLLYFHSGTNSRRMVEAVDGYNQSVQCAYQPLTNSSVYSRPQASSYRSNTNSSNLLDIQPPLYVVSRLTTVDGTGDHTTTSLNKDGNSNYITYTDTNSTTYTYQDAICSRLGLGMLGFLNVTSYNTITDYSTSNTYTVSPTFDNMVPSTSTVTAVSFATPISDGTYTYTPVSLGGLRYFLPETKSVTNDELGGVRATTTYTYTSDNHGNLQEKNTQISIPYNSDVIETTDVQNTYTTSATWIPAAVGTSTTTVTYRSNSPYTRALSNSWDGSGHLTSTTTDPSTSEAVTTANTYDSQTGALLSQTTTSVDATCATETNSWTYDAYSQFKTSSTNSFGQVTQCTYNPMWGKPASITTPDGLTTTYAYDAYGRSSQITTPDGLVQT